MTATKTHAAEHVIAARDALTADERKGVRALRRQGTDRQLGAGVLPVSLGARLVDLGLATVLSNPRPHRAAAVVYRETVLGRAVAHALGE